MLKGIDVSRYQNLKRILSIIDKPDFCIIKATEGKTWTDPKFKDHAKLCEDNDIEIGFYHYARPENNHPLEEAKHFVEKVKPYIGRCLLALDWEDAALKYPISWALTWLNYVYKETGVKPLFYCQASYTKNIRELYNNNYGLWVAHWTSLPRPITGAYPFWAIWQYSTPTSNYTGGQCLCDYDYFNGSIHSLLSYMKPLPKEERI